MIPQQAMSNDPLSPHTPSALPADADATVTGTDMVYVADLQPQPVEWLWQHRLAAGTLAMLSGEPGSGKTWVALATLRRAKSDIGVRSSKDGKSGAWWWTFINRPFCTTRLMPFVQSIFPHPQPTSRSRRQNAKNILLSASGNVRNLDLRHVTILYTAHPTAAPSSNTPRLPARKAPPTPPQARRLRRPAPHIGCLGPPGDA